MVLTTFLFCRELSYLFGTVLNLQRTFVSFFVIVVAALVLLLRPMVVSI